MEKAFIKNTIFNVGYRVLNVIFPLITSMYVSRILGPNGVGRVAYAQNILSYFLVFASVGIPTYGIKEIARNAYNHSRVSKSFLELFIINSVTTTICVIAYIILIISVPVCRDDIRVFLAVGISLFLNYLNIDWLYAGLEEYIYITVRSTLIKLIAIICLFVFVRSKDDVVTYALISSVGLSANYFLNIVNARKKISIDFQELEFKRHIKPVVILLLTMIATDLYNQIDITMMGHICSKEEIGYYSYSIKLVRIVTSIATAISATMLPRLSQYYSLNKKVEFQSFADKILNIVILLIVPCAAGIFLCSNNIIVVLYGLQFVDAIPLVKLFSPIILIISVSYLCGSIILTSINKEKYLLVATLTGACINIILNAIMIPLYHGLGAATASIVSELIVFAIHFIFASKYVELGFAVSDNFKVIIATLVMSGGVIIINKMLCNPFLCLVASVIGGGIIYFCFLLISSHEIVIEVKKRLVDFTRRQ